jgi:hypothetical protein
MGGPLSIGFPEPLKMRPSMSSDTGVFNTCEHIKREKMWVNSWTYQQRVKESKWKRIQQSIHKDKLVGGDTVIILN